MPSPIKEGDILVKLAPGRDPRLPAIYQTLSHPKHKGPGRIFYFLQDISKAGLKRVAQIEKLIKIPHGTHQYALDKGFMHLIEDDIVFVRATNAPSNGSQDVPCCWVTGGRIFSPSQMENLKSARDHCLGERDLRSRIAPVKENGRWIGGTAFERNARAIPVKENTRCYGIGNSAEPGSGLMAPHKGNKVLCGYEQDSLVQRENLVKAASSMGVESMKHGPEEVLTHLKLNAELLNLPRMGHEENVAYFAAQLNIAPAQPHGSHRTLQDAMGDFGGEHSDCGDNLVYYTHITVASDFPEGFDWGRFFILYPGVFITLSPLACINFCGRRQHGGTAPVAPPDANPETLQWATRFMVILYPQSKATSGRQRYVLAGLPQNKEPIDRKDRGWCVHAAYAEDGSVLLQRRSHCDFIARCIYSMALYVLLQMPESYGIMIDMDRFFSAFSFVDEDGIRWTLASWLKGPGYRYLDDAAVTAASLASASSSSSSSTVLSSPTNPGSGTIHPTSSNGSEILNSAAFVNQETVREIARQQWDWYYNHTASHIPAAAISKYTSSAVDEHANDVEIDQGGFDEDGEEEIEDVGLMGNKHGSQDSSSQILGGRPADLGKGKGKARTASNANLDGDEPMAKRAKNIHASTSKDISADFMHTNEELLFIPQQLRSAVATQHASSSQLFACPARSTRTTTVAQCVQTPETSFTPGRAWKNNVIHVDEGLAAEFDTPEVIFLRQNVSQIPVFLVDMTLELLNGELKDVKNTIAASMLESHGKNKSESQSVRALQIIQDAILHQPTDANTLVNVHISWLELRDYNAQSHLATLFNRHRHATTMLYHYTMWNWLDVYISNIVEKFLDNVPTSNEAWLKELIASVADMLELRMTKKTFVARVYGIPLSVEYTVNQIPSWHVSSSKKRTTVIQIVLEIIQHWLSFPDQQNARIQAWFLHAVISQFGVNILYLNHIWNTFNRVTHSLFRQGSWKLDSFNVMKPLIEAAPDHPLFKPESPESRVVSELSDIIIKYLDGRFTLQPANIQSLDTSGSQSIGDRLPLELQSVLNAKQQLFVDFLQDSMDYVLSGRHGTPAKFPKLRKAMMEKPDFVIPFREKAPSRVRSTLQDGPYHLSIIRTTKGIFSALVWRGITFNTLFSSNHPMIFDSYDDFETKKAAAGPQESAYFCDCAAYGQYDSGRTVDNAKNYWNALQDDVWPRLVQDRQISFLDAYNFFSYNPGKNKGGPRFPHLGPLGSYLITADLIYAGVVIMPSSNDMAWMIRRMNKGAISGLQVLGFLTPLPPNFKGKTRPMPNLDECQVAVQRTLKVMLDTIPNHLHDFLVIDLISLEHSLCKFSRAIRRKWL